MHDLNIAVHWKIQVVQGRKKKKKKGFSAMEGRSKTISTRQSHVIYIIASFSKSPLYRGGRILIHCLSLLPADAGNNGIIRPTQLLTGQYRLWADLLTRINGLVNGPGNWQ